jgi:thioredoxin-dependent peroxiredoxin
LELHKDDFARLELPVVAVALGQPKHARRFCGRLAPSVRCYCDQEAAVYATYGLEQSSTTSFLSPGLLKATARALAGGFKQGKATGDVRMLPGSFIVDGAGVVQYAYYNRHAGDHPDLARLLPKIRWQR